MFYFLKKMQKENKNSFPDLICYLVTSKCIANCDICISGVSIPDLSTKDSKKVISRIAENVKIISFAGREPFLRKDIFELVEHTKNTGVLMNIETTGALLNDSAFELLKKYNLDMISISIDSLDEKLCKSMGRVYLSENHLKYIADSCEESGIKLKVNSVVSAISKNELERIGSFLEKISPSIWKLRQFTPRSSGYNVREKYLMAEDEFLNIAGKIKSRFNSLKIEGKTTTQQSGTAFMIFPDGQIAKPDGKSHILYGSVLENDVVEIWKKHFSNEKKESHHDNFRKTYF
jgi:MoaA/NifB/PqqE/SkfB family radical SAM enzyme